MLETAGYTSALREGLYESPGPMRGMGLDRFAIDSAALSPYHRSLIRHLARRLASGVRPPQLFRVVYLIGHTDSRGPASYNLSLGHKRASAVRAELSAAMERIAPGSSRRIEFRIRSMGASRPAAPSNSAEGRARNRRVEIRLSPGTHAAQREAVSARIFTYDFEHLLEVPTPVAAPPLIYTENAPRTETAYVKIVLGGESPAQPMTGIFVPEKFQARDSVDIVLYLHGHHKGGDYPENLTIDLYWFRKRYPFFGFREGLNRSEYNAVLVAPTLGPRSEAGKLVQKDGLGWYLDQVLAALKSTGAYAGAAAPSLRNLIIACHSGGGIVMRQLALSKQRYVDNIRQCWGFDCLYNDGDETLWVDWAKANPSKRLFIDYGNGGTAARSERLRTNAKFVPNISVTGSDTFDHNHVPMRTWEKRLRSTKFLFETP